MCTFLFKYFLYNWFGLWNVKLSTVLFTIAITFRRVRGMNVGIRYMFLLPWLTFLCFDVYLCILKTTRQRFLSRNFNGVSCMTSSWWSLNVFILDRFSAVDSKGGVAPTAIVTVNLCNCSGHGKCLFGEHSEGQVLASTFRIVACKCNVGYTGMWRRCFELTYKTCCCSVTDVICIFNTTYYISHVKSVTFCKQISVNY